MSNVFTPDARRFDLHKQWEDTSKEAYLYDKKPGGRVECRLCPRRCQINPGSVGTCKVRKNIGGTLYAQSYGKATHVTIERIETEAIHHYNPGGKILSLGNFGCNLDCDYCQNWKYSQFQYTDPKEIHQYSSDQVIEYALANGVKMLSWTYNDPAVWFEFVVDTAKKARERGIQNLFKSAFFLSREAVEQLIEVIDVFAISIKAMDEEYYTRFTKGWLQPVLDCARLVHRSGRHMELSNLVVTDLTNNNDNYDKMIDFILNDLSPEIAIHFTRFHPDYKYTHVGKTPIEDVMAARARARERGVLYPYIGNAFDSEGLNTYCPKCETLLIQRYGLNTYIQDLLTDAGVCGKCGTRTPIKAIDPANRVRAEEAFR